MVYFLTRRKFLLVVSLLTLQLWFIFSSTSENHRTSSSVDGKNLVDIPKCKPPKKIALMRTHKCATSTIQNIFYRYAYENDLNVAILHPDNSTSEPGITVNQFTGTWKDPRWAGLEMDLLAAHFRWDKKMISNILGQESRIFTILRDPVDQFESSYSFHSLDKVYGLSLKELIQLLHNTSVTEINKKYGRLRTKDGTFGRNQMAWDLGLNPNSFDDEKAIENLIAEREKEFDLVMIAERSDESLILLRHLLCWPLESVTSLVSNTRKPEYIVKLNPEERQVLRQHWLGADDRLYRHFSDIFDAKVADFGQSAMKEEVGKLRLANQNVKERCVLKQVGNEELGDNYRSVHNKTLGYILNDEEPGCDLYGIINIAFHSIFRRRLNEKAAKLS